MSEPRIPSDAPRPESQNGLGLREVLEPDGVERAEGVRPQDGDRPGEAGPQDVSSSEVESPAKIIRIGAMLKQMLDEVRNTSLDEAAREQLRAIYEQSVAQLKTAMSEELGEELDQLAFDFSEDAAPTEAELRMAQAQLVGWLEGLFHGIQATLMAQQMAARQQLEGMRAQLPERSGSVPGGPGYL
jgi:hypothetical protein